MKRIIKVLSKIKWMLIYGIGLYLFLQFIISPGRVISGSMEPTLYTDDIIIYNRLEYLFHSPEFGDIVVFEKDNQMICKRVIGIAGDEITLLEDKVYRNGECLEEEYISCPDFVTEQLLFQVPEGEIFVLGDNRIFSFDGADWEYPYIKERNVKGKAIFTIPIHQFSQTEK